MEVTIMRRTLAIAAVGIVLAAGCSSKNDAKSTASSTDTGAPAASAGSSGTSGAAAAGKPTLEGTVTDKGDGEVKDGKVTLEIDDNYFKPTFVKGKAGESVEIEIESEGSNGHNFSVDSAKIDEAIDPGSKKSVKVSLPSSGSLAFYCKIHKSSGMQGAFFIG
jgi:plastocyanin